MNPSDTGLHVVVLGGNFAGLGSAQKIRKYAGDSVDITVIDRKSSLLFMPNISAAVFSNHNPSLSLYMDITRPLEKDHIRFIPAEVMAIDVEARRVDYVPWERPGAAPTSLYYDYLVIAAGCRLAYDRIEGFAEYGHSLSDTYYGNSLRRYLHEDYRGGPIAIGSARFHQGDGSMGLEPYSGGSIPVAEAACEVPLLETMLMAKTWLQQQKAGVRQKITFFTPAEIIVESVGEIVVKQLLEIFDRMDFEHRIKTEDIASLNADGIEFVNGDSLEAEVKIIFPDWVAHDFLRDLPVSDSQGFIKTNLLMRNPDYPHVFAAGDAAAVTVPKLGAIGHQQCEIVGRQIAMDMNRMGGEEAENPLQPVVLYIGDMGSNQACYIRSNTWYGGKDAVFKIGHVPYMLKMQYKTLFFASGGKVPNWGIDMAEAITERVFN